MALTYLSEVTEDKDFVATKCDMVQFKSFLCNRNLFCFDLLCFVTGSPYVGQSGLQLEIPLTSVFLGLQACATMLGLQWEFLRPLMYIINMEGQEQSTQHGLH